MIDIAREAVRSLDMAIDFGTASVRVSAASQHVREHIFPLRRDGEAGTIQLLP